MTTYASWRIAVGSQRILLLPSTEAGEVIRSAMEQAIARHAGPLDLSNADLSGVDLSGLGLRGADFFSSRLSDANLNGATLYAALLEGVGISRADMTKARIIGGGKGVQFSKAILIDANLGADPTNQGMVPVRAELPEASFDGADLTRADLTHAVLTSADFAGAIVTGARFDHAVLDGSNFQLMR